MTIRLSQLLTVRYWGTIVLEYLRIIVPILANIAQNMILSIVLKYMIIYITIICIAGSTVLQQVRFSQVVCKIQQHCCVLKA